MRSLGLKVQRLELEIKKQLESEGLVSNLKFYKGNLNDPENIPGLQYEIISGKEKEISELKKYIKNILIHNTSEGIDIHSNSPRNGYVHSEELRITPGVKFSEEKALTFRYHILSHMKKEINNYFMQTHKNNHSKK